MLTAILLAAIGLQPQRNNQQFFDDLLHWREQFESVLVEPSEEIGYTHVQSEMLGGAHGDAMYPIGSASERYVFFFREAMSGGTLMFQKRRGAKAFVVWHLPFSPVKKTTSVVGTVRKFLMAQGFAISRKARLTPAIRRQLSQTGNFAYYSFHPEMGGYASVVKPNGSSTKANRTPGPFFITDEEKKLLRPGFRP